MNHDEQDMLPFAGASDEARQWRERIVRLLDAVAWEARPCKVCGVKIWLLAKPTGKLSAWNGDATAHAETCRAPRPAGQP